MSDFISGSVTIQMGKNMIASTKSYSVNDSAIRNIQKHILLQILIHDVFIQKYHQFSVLLTHHKLHNSNELKRINLLYCNQAQKMINLKNHQSDSHTHTHLYVVHILF